MIELEFLDKSKTYVGYCVGTSQASRFIQHLSQQETDLPVDEIASHIFSLVYQNNEWFVFESHLKYNGCTRVPYKDWVKDYDQENIFCAPRELNIAALEFYANPLFNPGYSAAGLAGLILEHITETEFWNDNPGMICSEYIANADKDFKICYDYNQKPNRIKPVYWQMELLKTQKAKTDTSKSEIPV